MNTFNKHTVTSLLKKNIVPAILIACIIAFSVFFNSEFINKPKEKRDHINKLLADEKYAEAADLIYDFSYKEFSNKETIKQICNGKPELVLYTLEVGDTFHLGKYEQDGNLNNSSEPIEWRVVAIDGRKLTVQSVNVIENMPIHEGETTVTNWEDTSLSKWMNTFFYPNAFTEIEKSVILGGENEKVSLPDKNYDLKIGEQEISGTRAPATQYMKNIGITVNSDGLSPIWVFSKSWGKYEYSFCSKDDGNDFEGRKKAALYELSKKCGIRPVMTVNVSSLSPENLTKGAEK